MNIDRQDVQDDFNSLIDSLVNMERMLALHPKSLVVESDGQGFLIN